MGAEVSHVNYEGTVMQQIGELNGKMDRIISVIETLQQDVHKGSERQYARIEKVERAFETKNAELKTALETEKAKREAADNSLHDKITNIEIDRANQKGKLTIISVVAAGIGAILMILIRAITNSFIGS